MKICNADNCNNPVFGGGYCKFHQYLRQEKNKPIVSTSISSYKEKHIKPKRSNTGELELFKEVWNERPHVSEISGKPIHIFDINCFHHILTKGAYPEHRLNKDNIIILTRAEHNDVHQYSLDDLVNKHPMWKELVIRYGKIKFKN